MNERNDKERDNFVAYLDGELPAQERQRIEKQLVNDAAAREELSRLQESWEMLDLLPRTMTDRQMTQTTIAFVARSERSRVSTQPLKRRFPRRWLAVCLAACLGFVSVFQLLQLRRANRLRELPVVANQELYRYADSPDFLLRLQQEGLFVDE